MKWRNELKVILRFVCGESISMLNAAFSMSVFSSHTKRSLS